MGFYLSVAGFLGISGVLTGIARRRIPLLVVAMVFVFWAISALRYDTGYDWVVYKNYFNQFLDIRPADGGGIVPMEPLYLALNSLVAMLFGNFQILFILIASFNVWVILAVLRYARANILFCLFFYFCLIYLPLQMGVMRQSIAVSLFLLAMLYGERGGRWKVVALCAAGIGFHYSSVMYLVVFWRDAIKAITRRAALFILAVIGFYAAGIGFATVLITILSAVHISFISEKIAIYASSGLSVRSVGSAAYLFINCGIFLWVNRQLPEKTRFQEYLFGSLILQIMLQGLFFDFPLLWNRAQYLAILPQAILLSQAISRQQILSRAIALVGFLGFGLSSLTYQLMNPLIAPYVPYYSYIQYLITGDPGTGMERAQEYYRAFEQNQIR